MQAAPFDVLVDTGVTLVQIVVWHSGQLRCLFWTWRNKRSVITVTVWDSESRSAHLDVIFPDVSEYLHETRGAQKLANLFTKIDEF